MAKKRIPLGDSGAAFHTPFASLEGLKEKLEADAPRPPVPDDPADGEPDVGPAALTSRDRPIARFERKGHGGKAVVRVTKLALDPDRQAEVVRRLKRRLGVGARSEGAEILVQGEDVDRVVEALKALGATKARRG